METRAFTPRSRDWRSSAWPGGSFDTARRPYTRCVEGLMHSPNHLLLVTLRGSAERVEIHSADGHRYRGSDRVGAVSFVPAMCERHSKLSELQYDWASIAISSELVDKLVMQGEARDLDFAPFSNAEDGFIAALAAELERLLTLDGQLDQSYCELMTHALIHYLTRRYAAAGPSFHTPTFKLAPVRLRRIRDYVEAHLDREILVSELAALVDVSVGHLQRAFRASTGRTPLAYIQERRIRRAASILAHEQLSIAQLALRVGFLSPSHFARTFKRVLGQSPSRFRAGR